MNIEEKAVQIVAAAEVVTVASIDENGYPRPVAMVKLKDKNGGIYFSTELPRQKQLTLRRIQRLESPSWRAKIVWFTRVKWRL